MKRKTKLYVYVDKVIMDKPNELFQAAFAHFVKQGVNVRDRKMFMAQFMKAGAPGDGLKVIDEWVQVRDVATFPFRKREEQDKESDSLFKGGELIVSSGGSMGGAGKKFVEDTNINYSITDGETDESTDATGGVPVDDGADGEPESGVAPE